MNASSSSPLRLAMIASARSPSVGSCPGPSALPAPHHSGYPAPAFLSHTCVHIPLLPPNIPENNFCSFTVYDNQTRSMLRTPQRFPRAGSQSYPSPAAVPDADGSVDIYFGPEAPEGKESNWIQTVPV